MFHFRRKKKTRTEDEVFLDLIDEASRIDDLESPKKIEHMVLDSCEQIIAETKDIEGKKAEYKILTKYLEDIRRIGQLSPKEASAVKKAAQAIERTQKSRKSFLETPKNISDEAYALMAENERDVPREIERMKENEIYQSNTAAKMHALEADKGELRLDLDEAKAHTNMARRICLLLLVLFAASLIFMIAAKQYSTGNASQTAGIFLIVFALAASLLFMWQASSVKLARSLIKNLNSTITALNVTKMEYANVTRAINAVSEKYKVRSSQELLLLYRAYDDFNYRRERFARDDEDLTYWNDYLLRLLAPLRLYDSQIWLKQAAALVRDEDMKAVQDELVSKRAGVREQIRLETHQVKSERDEIDRLMKEADFYVPEIMEIISSVDRLCGLDRLRKEEDDSILKSLDREEEAAKKAAGRKARKREESRAEKKKRPLLRGKKAEKKDDKKMKVRTRFAPSPTGRMHVGNLRTALYAYLIAKHEGGDFILRIEDTDQERYVDGAVDIIYRTLKETGLSHDEGPDKDGGLGPYVQSERVRQGIYMKYARELIDRGEAYYCFCTPERLEGLKEEIVDENGEKKTISVYDKHCLHLSKEEIEANLASGMPYVIRQNNPRTGTTSFHDEIYGDITVDNSELDDMILIKSDGFPTYNFANVVDDHLMGITHVVRGNEYLSSSPKYNRLYEAFGWEVPKYIHCPLITNEDHQKLSKRSGHSSFEDLVEAGFLTDAIVNFVALLGWSPEDNQEIMNLPELIEKFDYHHINKSPAVFDITKLSWMNGEYIKRMDPDAFYRKALPFIDQVVHRSCDKGRIAALVQTRIENFRDIPAQVDFFEEVGDYELELYENIKNKCTKQNSLKVLLETYQLLSKQEDFSNDALFATLKEYADKQGAKTGFVMWPLRTALSGRQATPGGATQIMEILGKDESISRIKAAIGRLSS